jgi:hypothetical protein
LSCTSANPLTVINGQAVFAGCSISTAGNPYTLIATGAAFSVTSTNVSVS